MNIFRKVKIYFSCGLFTKFYFDVFFFKKKRKLFLEFKMIFQSSFMIKYLFVLPLYFKFLPLVFWL